MLPDQLLLPPSYSRGHFNAATERNRMVTLAGNADRALRLPQDVRIGRLVTDREMTLAYTTSAGRHGVYVFAIDGQAWANDTAMGRRDSIGIWSDAPCPHQAPPAATRVATPARSNKNYLDKNL